MVCHIETKGKILCSQTSIATFDSDLRKVAKLVSASFGLDYLKKNSCKLLRVLDSEVKSP